jgi:hypothetical protein
MSHQLTITLTDEEYAALAAEAERSGAPIEAVARERLSQRPQEGTSGLTRQDVLQHLQRQRLIESIPTGEPDTPEEEAEAERLAQLFSGGKSGAEMVIEDRGPY